MTCACAPSLVAYRDQWDAAWPDRDRASDGCCGDAAHAGRKSDHNPTPKPDGYAHAFDLDENYAPGQGLRPLWEYVPLLLMDPRTKYPIYEGHIWYADCRDHGNGLGCWAAGGHAYTGQNAHEHHLHLSIRPTATHDTRPWPMLGAPTEESDVDRKVLGKNGNNDLWLVFTDPATGLAIGGCYRIPTQAQADSQIAAEQERLKKAGRPHALNDVRQTWAGSRLDPVTRHSLGDVP